MRLVQNWVPDLGSLELRRGVEHWNLFGRGVSFAAKALGTIARSILRILKFQFVIF